LDICACESIRLILYVDTRYVETRHIIAGFKKKSSPALSA
jgi:hypothetical protein